jgi:hypothetical protein
MKDSKIIEQLLEIADGDIDLVQQALRASAENDDGAADLKKVVDYITSHRQLVKEPAAA